MIPSDYVGPRGVCRCCGGSLKGLDVFEGCHRYYNVCADELQKLAPIDSAMAFGVQLLSRVLCWCVRDKLRARADEPEAAVELALILRGWLNKHIFQGSQPALAEIVAMADREVQQPGDNHHRFRALIRIRDYAESHISSRSRNSGAGQDARKDSNQ